MKKILIVFVAAVTIIGCKDADTKAGAPASAADSLTVSKDTSNAANNSHSHSPQPAAIDSANLTTIEWLDGQDRDFGKIKKGETLNVTFRFKNTGDKPLVISDVAAGCGCTVPEKPKKPFAPGETGEIKASFDSNKGTIGLNSKSVTVYANTNPNSIPLIFRVEVKEKS